MKMGKSNMSQSSSSSTSSRDQTGPCEMDVHQRRLWRKTIPRSRYSKGDIYRSANRRQTRSNRLFGGEFLRLHGQLLCPLKLEDELGQMMMGRPTTKSDLHVSHRCVVKRTRVSLLSSDKMDKQCRPRRKTKGQTVAILPYENTYAPFYNPDEFTPVHQSLIEQTIDGVQAMAAALTSRVKWNFT